MIIFEKTKVNNKQYTKECKKIFEEIKFAEIETKNLITSLLLVTVLYVTIIFFIIFDSWVIVTWIQRFDLADSSVHIGSSIGIIFSLLWIGGSIFGIAHMRKKNKVKETEVTLNYYICVGENHYEITLRNDYKERVINSIVCFETKQILYIGEDTAEVEEYTLEKDALLDFTGFYQYMVIPERVIRHSYIVTNNIYKYKKVMENKTMYYFPNFKSAKGEKYPRSILLEDGIVRQVCVQESYNSPYKDNRHTSSAIVTERKQYSHVNDSDCKLFVFQKGLDEAKKSNFPFPNCSNIITEKTMAELEI